MGEEPGSSGPLTTRQVGGRPEAAQRREYVPAQAPVLWDQLPDLLTPKEACRALRVGETKFREELRRPGGSLQGLAFRWGRRYLIPKEALRRLVEGGDDDAA